MADQGDNAWGPNPKPTSKPGPGIYVTSNGGKDQTKVVGTNTKEPGQHG
jgi:hypothetical protein